MKKPENSRRKFIVNSSLFLTSLSLPSFNYSLHRLNKNNRILILEGGVRYEDVNFLLKKNKYPGTQNTHLFEILVEGKNKNHIEKTQKLNEYYKSLNNHISLDFKTKSGFDCAHFSYLEYIHLLNSSLYEAFAHARINMNAQNPFNLLITSEFGRNNYFNELNENSELSGIDHDGDGSEKTFGLLISSSIKQFATFKKSTHSNLFSTYNQLISAII